MIVGSTVVVCVLLCVSVVTGEAAGITQWHCVTAQQEKQPQAHHKGKSTLFSCLRLFLCHKLYHPVLLSLSLVHFRLWILVVCCQQRSSTRHSRSEVKGEVHRALGSTRSLPTMTHGSSVAQPINNYRTSQLRHMNHLDTLVTH